MKVPRAAPATTTDKILGLEITKLTTPLTSLDSMDPKS
jgi:hypothetical protein